MRYACYDSAQRIRSTHRDPFLPPASKSPNSDDTFNDVFLENVNGTIVWKVGRLFFIRNARFHFRSESGHRPKSALTAACLTPAQSLPAHRMIALEIMQYMTLLFSGVKVAVLKAEALM